MKFFNNGWDEVLEDEFKKEYFQKLLEKVDEEYSKFKVFPPRNKIFSALTNCDIKDINVVILGQDPYHEEGQAHGMCFSVLPGVEVPPSLKNIYKEIENEYGFAPPNHGYLMSWAKQGVLLLNTTLTVREHQANSHASFGWQKFTDRVIEEVNKQDRPVVFILWGRNAISKKPLIDESKHLILTSVHPSPLSAYGGFFGNNHFKLANEFLEKHGRKPIDWQIKNI
ncbi:MAG: uracil-DNA glycosylase [Clostridia bacterium]|nr:uracil-DNA glycosylase [Clostridia bacterium]